MPIDSNGELVF